MRAAAADCRPAFIHRRSTDRQRLRRAVRPSCPQREHTFAALSGPELCVSFFSGRASGGITAAPSGAPPPGESDGGDGSGGSGGGGQYADRPLTVRGPFFAHGTSSGLYSDLLAVARCLGAQDRPGGVLRKTLPRPDKSALINHRDQTA